MTGRLLEFPVRRPFSGVIEINGFCDSTRTFAPRHLPFKCEMNRASRASAMGLGCVRGTTLGLLFEVATGLVIYGLWQLWHVLR